MNSSFKFIIGAIVAVVMFGCGDSGSFTDKRDGKNYRTVKMPDGKTWMAENLNYQTENSWCYDNDESNCDTYGRLYDWNTALTACPQGWRLPNSAEWNALIVAVGDSATAGAKLKSQNGWQGNGNGTDDFGFSALPGGYRWDGSFGTIGFHGYWWSANEGDAAYARSRFMGYNRADVGSDWLNKIRGLSVRCVRG